MALRFRCVRRSTTSLSFPPPNPGPRIRKGVLADPVLVVIVWWPRIEGYTHQLSAECVRGSVSTGGLYECGCSPPRAQTPTLTAETGQTAGVGWSTLQCG
jgi:hypothetical protein